MERGARGVAAACDEGVGAGAARGRGTEEGQRGKSTERGSEGVRGQSSGGGSSRQAQRSHGWTANEWNAVASRDSRRERRGAVVRVGGEVGGGREAAALQSSPYEPRPRAEWGVSVAAPPLSYPRAALWWWWCCSPPLPSTPIHCPALDCADARGGCSSAMPGQGGAAASSLPLPAAASSRRPRLRRLRGHSDSVNDVAVVALSSPSSRRLLLATASDDCTARIWDVHGGRTVQAVRWRGGEGRPSVQGKESAAASRGEGAEERLCSSPPLPVVCCAFDQLCPASVLYTAHGPLIAVWGIGVDGERAEGQPPSPPVLRTPLCCLSTRAGQRGVEEVEREAEAEINGLALSSDGRLLVAADDSGRWFSWAIQRRSSDPSDPAHVEAPPVTLERTASPDVTDSTAFVVGHCAPMSATAAARHSCTSTSVSTSSSTSSPSHASWPPPLFPYAFRCFSMLSTPHSSLCSSVTLGEWRVRGKGSDGGEGGSSARWTVASVGFDCLLRLSAVDGVGESTCVDVRHLLAGSTSTSSAEVGPLLNPPYPQCVAMSCRSSVLLIGLGSGALLWVDPSLPSTAMLRASLSAAHSSAVVSVRYVGEGSGERGSAGVSVEYWASAGSDRRLALWKVRYSSRVADRTQQRKGRRKQQRQPTATQPPTVPLGAERVLHQHPPPPAAPASSASLDCSLLDVLLPPSPASAAPSVVCLWSALHPVKLNAIEVSTAVGEVEVQSSGSREEQRSGSTVGCCRAGDGKVRALTLWAVGVSCSVFRYELQLG